MPSHSYHPTTRPMKFLGLLSCPAWLVIASYFTQAAAAENEQARAEPYTPANELQMMSLGKSAKPRFALPDITWPAAPDAPSICLWQDDLYAACSITIDDNNLPDHPWWMQICEKYDFKVTFFVITGKVGGANSSYDGTWDDWRAVLAAGHDVQSHSVTHPKTGDTDPDDVTIGEYAESKAAIEDNLPGHRCVALAYPWGKGRPDIAKDYYIAVRGVTGTPSMANQINYLDTTDGSLSPDQVNAILGLPAETKWLNNPRYKRGWIQPLFHLVAAGKTPEEKQAAVSKVEKNIEYLIAHRDQIWIDTFVHVATYAQERDSATLQVTTCTDKRIEFSLTDTMRDDLFDYPLSVKVRLPPTWKQIDAHQGDASVISTIIAHDGMNYALVRAVPDRGTVAITPR
jgi:peptidoglycan/xylan/chitin deacetylase (PgdA/CDA1 family)